MAIQTRMRVTKGKAKNIDACADDRGIIRAAAMDQRGSLMREIGKQGGAGTPESLTEFKTAVTKALTPYATAILMDPEYGLPALKAKAPNAGVLLAYERSGYDADPENRMPDVLRGTVRDRHPEGRGPGEHGVRPGLEGEQERGRRIYESRGAAAFQRGGRRRDKAVHLSLGGRERRRVPRVARVRGRIGRGVQRSALRPRDVARGASDLREAGTRGVRCVAPPQRPA